ncbi:hypothetical protein [Roseomonas genomospecies 6]|uniref:Uncharacterized protein n=1 Tax=Roseomonas genomospecies 6 TaxID=214106 RepID=A0A9W7KQF7_9PROT|nr:hypothetical protein [Roseomonas genomospecies 6]KAA0677671.1 hypothetical protein DS843_22800 [Roseomonas genomospecies 6]
MKIANSIKNHIGETALAAQARDDLKQMVFGQVASSALMMTLVSAQMQAKQAEYDRIARPLSALFERANREIASGRRLTPEQAKMLARTTATAYLDAAALLHERNLATWDETGESSQFAALMRALREQVERHQGSSRDLCAVVQRCRIFAGLAATTPPTVTALMAQSKGSLEEAIRAAKGEKDRHTRTAAAHPSAEYAQLHQAFAEIAADSARRLEEARGTVAQRLGAAGLDAAEAGVKRMTATVGEVVGSIARLGSWGGRKAAEVPAPATPAKPVESWIERRTAELAAAQRNTLKQALATRDKLAAGLAKGIVVQAA